MSIRVACIGTGYIAKIHARAVINCGAELAAVVNYRPESMAAFAGTFGVSAQYETIDDLLKHQRVDAVMICTPNALHAPQAIKALQAGVHVIVEKPMAVSAAEAEAMNCAAQEANKHLMVAHVWRFDEDVLWLKDRLHQVGKIIRTKGVAMHTYSGPGGWFTQKALSGGGALADMGIHALDTTRFLLGDPNPVSVYARMGTYYRDIDVEDTGFMLVNWENGAHSTVEFGWWQPYADGMTASTQVYGSHGFGQLFPTRVMRPPQGGGKWVTIEAEGPFPRKDHTPQSLYDRQMQHFLTCIETGKSPLPGGMEGWINMKLIDAAYKSARTGEIEAV